MKYLLQRPGFHLYEHLPGENGYPCVAFDAKGLVALDPLDVRTLIFKLESWLDRVGYKPEAGRCYPQHPDIHWSDDEDDARGDLGNHGGWLLCEGDRYAVVESDDVILRFGLRTNEQLEDLAKNHNWSELEKLKA